MSSATATPEPLEVDVDADELPRGRADLPGGAPREDPAGGDHGGDGGRDLPPSPPPPRGRRKPERPPRWQRILMLGILVLVMGSMTGWLAVGLGRAIAESS